MNVVEFLEKSSRSARWTGIAFLVLGFLALIAPLAAGLSVTVLVGVLIAMAGLLQLFLVFQAGSVGRGLLLLLFGLLSLVAGAYMVMQPIVGLANLTLFLAAYFIVSGFLELLAAFQARPMKGWGWFAFSSAVSVLLGIMIWRQFPVSGVWAVGVLIGVRLLTTGSVLLAVGSAGSRVAQGASKIESP